MIDFRKRSQTRWWQDQRRHQRIEKIQGSWWILLIVVGIFSFAGGLLNREGQLQSVLDKAQAAPGVTLLDNQLTVTSSDLKNKKGE